MTPLLILSGKFEFILLPLKICDGYLKTDKDCLEEWIEMKRQNLKLTRSQTAINRNINFFCPFLVIYFLQICSIFFLLTFNHYSSYVSAMPILKNLLWVDVWTKRWECVSICSIALGRIIFLWSLAVKHSGKLDNFQSPGPVSRASTSSNITGVSFASVRETLDCKIRLFLQFVSFREVWLSRILEFLPR